MKSYQIARFIVTAWFLVSPVHYSSALAAFSSGTGFFITTDGYFLTCFHLIDGANRVVLKDTKGNSFDAEIVAVDRANDIAVLKANGKFTALPIGSVADVRRGTSVFTIGFPNLDIQGLEPKLTNGVVSSLSGIADDPRAFQVTVPIQPGNSGGPLVTSDGNVVGIVTSKLDAIKVLRATGDLAQNVNYAVKSSYATALLSGIPNAQKRAAQQFKRRFKDLSDVSPIVERAIALVLVDTNRALQEQASKERLEREQAERTRKAREEEAVRQAEASRRFEAEQGRQREVVRLQTTIANLGQLEQSFYNQILLTQRELAMVLRSPPSFMQGWRQGELESQLSTLRSQLTATTTYKIKAMEELSNIQGR